MLLDRDAVDVATRIGDELSFDLRWRRGDVATWHSSTGIAPGILFGMLAGFAVKQRSFPNLEPLDWVAFGLVSALLLATGLLAAVLPFRRVLRDQYAALREL